MHVFHVNPVITAFLPTPLLVLQVPISHPLLAPCAFLALMATTLILNLLSVLHVKTVLGHLVVLQAALYALVAMLATSTNLIHLPLLTVNLEHMLLLAPHLVF